MTVPYNQDPNYPNRKPTADELLQKFYATKEPAPVFDQAKADRLKRMGKINQIGQGVKVLGDMFGTALGANVRRRQPDATAPALYQSYQNMLDRYEQQKEAFNYRDFQTQRDNLRFGIGRADRDTQVEMANRKQADWMKAKEADNKLSWEKWTADYDLKQKQYGVSVANAESNRIRANKAGTTASEPKPDKAFKPIEVYDDSGNKILRSQADWSKDFQEAQKDKVFTKDHLATLLSNYQAMPDGGRMQIATDYYNWKQQQRLATAGPDMSGSKIMLTNPGMTNTPSAPAPAAPKIKAPSLDFSKLIY